MYRARGFTLIELVAIMVLLGVLAVFVAPRFSGSGSFAEITVRDRMVAIARYVQQRAMYDQSLTVCYRFHIDQQPLPPAVQSYGAQRSTASAANFPDASFAFIGPANSDSNNPGNALDGRIALADNVAIANTAAGAINIYFDGLGNPLANCRGAVLVPANPGDPVVTINIAGEFPQTVTVSGAGYVQ